MEQRDEMQMRGEPTKSKSIPWLKIVFFLPPWLLAFIGLFVFSVNSELNTYNKNSWSPQLEFEMPKNRIGAFRYIRGDPDNSGRPLCSVYFKNLVIQSGTLGVFKTGLYKVVQIQDLQLEIFLYSSSGLAPNIMPNQNESGQAKVKRANIPLEFRVLDIFSGQDVTDATKGLNSIIGGILTPVKGWRADIDLSNVSEVRINNCDYRVFYDGQLVSGVRSKRAIVSSDWPEVTLRGHVIITALDGSTLESNCVRWKIRQNIFLVDGIYVLSRNGTKIIGKNICVDAGLNETEEKKVTFSAKERMKCTANIR